jgi:gamma-glutamyltranspeptidase
MFETYEKYLTHLNASKEQLEQAAKQSNVFLKKYKRPGDKFLVSQLRDVLKDVKRESDRVRVIKKKSKTKQKREFLEIIFNEDFYEGPE